MSRRSSTGLKRCAGRRRSETPAIRGIVLARRLSNAEYDYTIRDLTGVDIRPTREFPIDPANEAGFDNSGESLTLFAGASEKVSERRPHISEHLVLKSDGLEFAPTRGDQHGSRPLLRQPHHRLLSSHETDLAALLSAAWHFQHRAAWATGGHYWKPRRIGRQRQVSSNSFGSFLKRIRVSSGPVAEIRKHGDAFPPRVDSNEADAPSLRALRDRDANLRAPLSPTFPPSAREENDPSGRAGLRLLAQSPECQSSPLAESRRPESGRPDPPERSAGNAAFEKFCSVFPNAFYISETGREFLDPDEKSEKLQSGDIEKGRSAERRLAQSARLLSRRRPLCELILTESEQRELDTLWLDLDVVARPPFDSTRVWSGSSELIPRSCAPRNLISRARRILTWFPRRRSTSGRGLFGQGSEAGSDAKGAEAIREHFRIINEQIRRLERAAETRSQGI